MNSKILREKLNKFWEHFKNPSLWVVCLNWAISVAGIAGSLTFVILSYGGVVAYIVYAVAGVSLAYSVFTVIRFAPRVKERVTVAIKRKKFTRTLLEDYGYRTLVFSVVSLVINLAFVAFNLALSILNGSVWYGSLAGYYFMLSALRGGLFIYDAKAKRRADGDKEVYLKGQIKNYRFCGVALFVLDFVMAGAVTLMVLDKSKASYTEILAIVYAAYTCYKITFAILNIVKAKKTDNLQIKAFRNVGLTDAGISLLSLQVALVSTFSDGVNRMMPLNAITGFTVCILAVVIGIVMIVVANKKLKLIDK